MDNSKRLHPEHAEELYGVADDLASRASELQTSGHRGAATELKDAEQRLRETLLRIEGVENPCEKIEAWENGGVPDIDWGGE